MSTRPTFAALVLAAGCAHLFAQPVPGPIDPGRLGRELRPPPSPRVQPELPAPRPPAARPAGPQGPALRVDAIRLEGATVIDEAELRPLYAELIGRSVHLDEVERAADRITAHYRNAGYLLAQVIVPEQALTD